jgi:hypothetical protein
MTANQNMICKSQIKKKREEIVKLPFLLVANIGRKRIGDES